MNISEEFIVILPNTDLVNAGAVAERIRQRIMAEPIQRQDVSVPLTMSLGMAKAKAVSDDSIEGIIGRADQVLYKAKEQGRNCIQIYP